jgi:hypothetical protein
MMSSNPLIKKLFSPSSVLVRILSRMVSKHPILKKFGYFYNPNTLESWNCRWCQDHSDRLPIFLHFQNLCASAFQVNMVNVTDRKILDSPADYTVEALAQKYKQGYRLDIDYITKNKPAQTHCGTESFILCPKAIK